MQDWNPLPGMTEDGDHRGVTGDEGDWIQESGDERGQEQTNEQEDRGHTREKPTSEFNRSKSR